MSSTAPLPEVEGSGGAGLDVFARKARQREIQGFRDSLGRDDPLFEELDKVGSYPPQDILYNALRLNNRTVTVIAEYFRKAPFEYLGSVLEPAVSIIIIILKDIRVDIDYPTLPRNQGN